MAAMAKEKERKRPDKTFEEDGPSKEGLEIKTFTNGSSPHYVTTSLISSNGQERHLLDEQKIEVQTSADPYSIDMNDPYRYGYRHLFKTVGDEITIVGRKPLTLEDLLHPEEEDRRMQNSAHSFACYYLQASNFIQFDDEPDAVILHDVRIDWSVAGIKPFGPDITVILGSKLDAEPEGKGTYVTGEDGPAPIMVFEITSPSTRPQDFFDKPILMQKVGLPYYFVVDIATRNKRVYGYELNEDGCYIGIRPDDQGRVWVEPAKMWLGLNGKKVECFDADGNLLLTYSEIARALNQQTERANAETERADEEARRRREADVRARIAGQRVEQEAEKRQEADERARIAAQKAAQEAERAEEEARQRQEADERARLAAQQAEKAMNEIESILERLRQSGIDPETFLSTNN